MAFGLAKAEAKMIATIDAPPDIRLIAAASQPTILKVQRVLADFAREEHLTLFRDAPRAKGNQFFVSYYSEDYNFIAEKVASGKPLIIECYDLDSSTSRLKAEAAQAPYYTASPFGKTVIKLEEQLRRAAVYIAEERR